MAHVNSPPIRSPPCPQMTPCPHITATFAPRPLFSHSPSHRTLPPLPSLIPSKREHPGFSGVLPTWGFGSPGVLGSPQRRLTALPGTLQARPDKNDFFTTRNLIAYVHIKMVSRYGLCPLSGCVVGQVRSKIPRRHKNESHFYPP